VKADRQLAILSILQRDRSAEVSRLSQELGASKVTIRRDLLELERQGLVRATRGGAILNQGATYEPGYIAKIGQEREEKARIAKVAAAMNAPGDTILLDAGTTTAAIAQALVGMRDLTVISNSLAVANVLTRHTGVRFIMIGGTFRDVSQAFLGRLAEDALRDIRVDRVFLATEAMDVGRGLEVPDDGDASVKRVMVACGREVVVVADHTKFELQRLFTFASWQRVNKLVTGREASDRHVDAVREQGVSVVLA
jgi:DeoR family fructose operon transcriptional repressor